MTTTIKSVSELKRQLETEVNQWVDRTFNFIQLNVIETMARAEGSELIEFIENEDLLDSEGAQMFIDEYSHESEYLEYLKDNEDATPLDFITENYNDDFDEWRYEQQSDNYPMWNTLFEFRHSAHCSELGAAQKSGIGLINAFGDFNDILFMASCGHSFMAAYWIPMYLNWNDRAREEYAGISYSDL